MDHVDHLIMALACLAWSGAVWVIVDAGARIWTEYKWGTLRW